MSDVATTETWVCVGRRETTTGKLAQAWRNEEGETRLFAKPLCSAEAGQTFAISLDPDRRVFSGGQNRPSFIGFHEDAAAVTGWEAETRGLDAAFAAEALRKKAGRDPELEAALDVLSRAYAARKSWAAKSGFLSYVTARVAG